MAKLTAGGGGIDVAFVSGQYAQALNDAGLLEPIHEDLVPNLENLYPEATELAYDEGNSYSVPYTWGTTGICYRSDLVDPAPTSWNDLLEPDPAYDGKITMLSTERWLALPGPEGAGLLGQHHRRRRARGHQGEAGRGQEAPARLRRHHLLREAHLRRGRDDRGLGRLVRLRDGREPRHQVRGARGGQRPLDRHDGRAEGLGEQGSCLRVHQHDARPRDALLGHPERLLQRAERGGVRTCPGGAQEAVPAAGRHARGAGRERRARRPRRGLHQVHRAHHGRHCAREPDCLAPRQPGHQSGVPRSRAALHRGLRSGSGAAGAELHRVRPRALRRRRVRLHPGQLHPGLRADLPQGAGQLAGDRGLGHGDRPGHRLPGGLRHRQAALTLAVAHAGAGRHPVLDQLPASAPTRGSCCSTPRACSTTGWSVSGSSTSG